MRNARLVLLVTFLIVILVTLSYADVPKLINYQGHLTDKGGNPLTGTYGITFTIWDADTGGNSQWTETQSSVSVKNGLFSVLLGSATTGGIPESVFDDPDRWLGVAVESDSETSPRQQLVSVPYAYRAGHANTTPPTQPVPKTGQTLCYDNDGTVIDCTGTGQDGEYQVGYERFTDNGDETVTDNYTGLMWMKNPNHMPPTPSNTWLEALTFCNDLTLSNYSDWRLCNIYELKNILELSPIMRFFPNETWGYFYWTSTSCPLWLDYALVIITSQGFHNTFSRYDKDGIYGTNRAWCVRGGQ